MALSNTPRADNANACKALHSWFPLLGQPVGDGALIDNFGGFCHFSGGEIGLKPLRLLRCHPVGVLWIVQSLSLIHI